MLLPTSSEPEPPWLYFYVLVKSAAPFARRSQGSRTILECGHHPQSCGGCFSGFLTGVSSAVDGAPRSALQLCRRREQMPEEPFLPACCRRLTLGQLDVPP